jgi:hypothetical protein
MVRSSEGEPRAGLASQELSSTVVTNDFVHVSIRRNEVLPDPAEGALWLRVEELRADAK